MRKYISIIMVLCTVFVFAGCGGAQSQSTAQAAESAPDSIDAVPVILDQNEYLLYQNVFYNDYGDQYVGKAVSKEGVFTTLYDSYSQKVRYYVWGYLDNTRCCDWQWEIVPASTNPLPPIGSLIRVTGTFTNDENALDGYWITDAVISTVSKYTGNTNQIEMDTMSGTLERVQIANIVGYPGDYEGKTFSAYGRVEDIGMLQDPYYDGSWQIPFSVKGDMPAIGATVHLEGTITDCTLSNCEVSLITD